MLADSAWNQTISDNKHQNHIHIFLSSLQETGNVGQKNKPLEFIIIIWEHRKMCVQLQVFEIRGQQIILAIRVSVESQSIW